jgi:NAD(P)-dependent dehydrogenase (short-subunit alcohol dehydrogenase family)
MDLKLKGRSVLVTGASKGIGLSVAQWFAREGVNVHMSARNGEAMEKAAREMREQYKVDVKTHALDLSSQAARDKLTAACPDVDIVINNAGDIPGGTLDDVSDAAWRAGWDLKVFGYINLTRFYLERMKARRNGVIINVAGSAGVRPSAGYIAGSVGNASVMAFSLAMGAESPNYGVRVICVNPGPIETDRTTKLGRFQAQQKLGDASRYKELQKDFPFGRPGHTDEVSAMIVFLASDLSSYTSGCIINVDGGITARR